MFGDELFIPVDSVDLSKRALLMLSLQSLRDTLDDRVSDPSRYRCSLRERACEYMHTSK